MTGQDGHNLIFIVGAPRSGTTWLQRLLAAHPSIRTGQESKLFRSYISPQLEAWRWEAERERDARTATGRGGIGLSCYFTDEEFTSALRDFTDRLLEPMTGSLGPNEVFVEKTPSHALCLADIRSLLPASRIIHVLRDGRDVVASLMAASRSWGVGWAPRATREAAATWVRFVRAAREGRNLFPASQFHEVRYEELVNDADGALRQIATFLRLDWSDADLTAAVRANAPSEVRSGRGTPIQVGGRFAVMGEVKDPPEFVRRGTAGGWRDDLSPLQKIVTWGIAGDLLSELGYAWPFFDRLPRPKRILSPQLTVTSAPR